MYHPKTSYISQIPCHRDLVVFHMERDHEKAAKW